MGRPLPPNLAAVDVDEDDVILGMPGPWAEDNREASDHYTTKVGGLPDWPSSLGEVNNELLKCSVCGGDLGLVAQVYAPLGLSESRSKIDERALFIFGCPSSSCGISPLSWRTLRLQKDGGEAESSSNEASSTPSSSAGDGTESTVENIEGETSTRDGHQESSDWWEDDSSWGPVTQVEPIEDDVGNLGVQELEAALLEAGYAAARPQAVQAEITETHDDSSNEDSYSSDVHVLPCFYIYSQNESHPSRGSRAVSALQSSERLEEDSREANPDVQDEVWEGEEYEHDQALSADRTYLKFKKRLDCYPEQCFRYCFGGRPLWANKDRGDPGVCSICRGPRVYEMQLMPPLLYYLQQACKDNPSTSHGPNDWEWLTLIVYTCAQSCTRSPSEARSQNTNQRRPWTIVEEATILQYET